MIKKNVLEALNGDKEGTQLTSRTKSIETEAQIWNGEKERKWKNRDRGNIKLEKQKQMCQHITGNKRLTGKQDDSVESEKIASSPKKSVVEEKVSW